jgi:PAS domain S-box-containing protein
MTKSYDYPPADFQDLRQRAEERLHAWSINPKDLTSIEAARLIRELQVHQIELEMQNEDLRLSQTELEESRSKYADLYDCAPVGYLTLDGRGGIEEANLTAATLLGVEHHKLRDHFFSHFLVEADRLVFLGLLSRDFPQKKLREEFRLQDINGGRRTMLLDILFLQDAKGQKRLRITMTDITERKLAEEALQQAHYKLEQRVLERTTELQNTVDQLQWEVMERQQMEVELRQSEKGLRVLAAQLLTAQETERGRLARELHDDLGQSLLFLRMQLNGMLRHFSPNEEFRQGLEEASEYLLGIIDKVRHLSQDLSPPILERLGLVEAVQDLIETFKRYHNPEMIIKTDLDDIKDMVPEEANIVIYRITQEFLANVAKHSEATQVVVTIKAWPEKISIDLKDDGIGFDPVEIKERPGERRGLGLASMEERLRMLGSQINLTSQQGKEPT